MSIIHDFKSIRRKLERQEQKAEFEEKNPKPETSMYGWLYGAVTPLMGAELPSQKTDPEVLRKLYQAAADCAALSCGGFTVKI